MQKFSLIILALSGALSLSAALRPEAGEPLFEAETVLTNRKVNSARKRGIWYLWDSDSDRFRKWGGGVVLSASALKEETAPEKSPLGILKFQIPVPRDGMWAVAGKLGDRPLMLSVDGGKSWKRWRGEGKLTPWQFRKKGEFFEILVSHCLLFPGNPGPVYVDYFVLLSPERRSVVNADWSEKATEKESIPGWKFSTAEPERNRMEYQVGKVRVSAKGQMGWSLHPNRRIMADPGEIFHFTIPVRNVGKNRARIRLHVYGGRQQIGMKIDDLAPGASAEVTLAVVVPEECDGLNFDIAGYGRGEFEISPVRCVAKGHVSDSVQIEFSSPDAELVRQLIPKKSDGKWQVQTTSLLEFLPGKTRRLSFKAKALKEKAELQWNAAGFSGSEPACRSLAGGKVVLTEKEQTISADFPVPVEVSGIRLELQGCGACQLSGLSLTGGKAEPKKMETRKVPVPPGAEIREKLGRCLFAATLADGSVYLSWRLLPGEENRAFNVYGADKNGKITQLNDRPVSQTTDFIVPKARAMQKYGVQECGVSVSPTVDTVPLPYEKNTAPYREYQLGNKLIHLGFGDLDGDGEYDLVAQTGAENIDPWHVVWHPSHSTYKIEAIRRDGRKLWEFDCGYNVECGVWYAPVGVCDLDGDGKAEVILKGSLPEDGDCRENSGVNIGRVISGAERLLVLDGMSGKLLAHAPWPERREFLFPQGRGFGYSFRNMLAFAKVDGKRPAIITLRGTYGLMLAEAWRYERGKLTKLWSYTTAGLPGKFRGQGAHTARVADLDGDGREEIILGGAVIDDDGSPLWSTGHGHPDYLYVGDLVPQNPGMEIATIYETPNKRGGFTMADAASGKLLWELDAPSRHIHRGYCGDMDARYRGAEIGGADSISGGHYGNLKHRHYAPDGTLLAEDDKAPFAKYRGFVPHFVFWDNDLQREVWYGQPQDFRGGSCGGPQAPGSFVMQCDLEGDWREEVVCRVGKNKLRIYHTVIPATDRRVSLTCDPVYRNCIAASSSGYLYDPTLSYDPVDRSPGLNLTALSEEQNTLEITVSAPADKKISGKVTLTASAGITVEPAVWQVDCPKGRELTRQFKIRRGEKSRGGVVTALLQGENVLLKSSVPVKRQK